MIKKTYYPLFHRLRRKQARRFLREWTAARIRDDGPYVIANWGECMADGYLARLITETQTRQGSPQIMADALDRLRPGWFDSTYDSLLGAFVNQTSNTQELKAILDGHRPNWMKNNPVVRRAYANALANADITEFNRWHLLLRENDPEWLSQGLFQDFPESFRQIAMTLRQHASGATPNVLTVPERQGNYGDWPNIWYKDVHRVDYATDARSIWLKSLLWLAEQAVAHPGLPTLPIEDLRSLATLDHIGIRDKLGSYTEVYQSDPDSFSREETIVVRGLAWVQRCDSLQRLANARLAICDR